MLGDGNAFGQMPQFGNPMAGPTGFGGDMPGIGGYGQEGILA